MRRRDEEPARLGDVLDALASRIRRVDLRSIDEVRARWASLVDPALAESCRPEFVRSSTLVVSAPTGAHAQRVRARSATILAGLADLEGGAPTSLKVVVREPL